MIIKFSRPIRCLVLAERPSQLKSKDCTSPPQPLVSWLGALIFDLARGIESLGELGILDDWERRLLPGFLMAWKVMQGQQPPAQAILQATGNGSYVHTCTPSINTRYGTRL